MRAVLRRLRSPSTRRFCTKSAPTYAQTWTAAVEQYGQLPALTFDGLGPSVTYTFNEVESQVNRLSNALRHDYGIEQGDMVVTITENRPEIIALMLSCQKIGAAFIPLASDLSKQDCQTIVNMYEPTLVITDRPQHQSFPRAAGDGEYRVMSLPEYRKGESELTRLCSAGSDEPVDITVNPDDPGIIFSTSGSTGLPKGVVYSNSTVSGFGNLPANLRAQGTPWWELNPGDSALLWVPIRGVGSTLMALSMLPDGIHQVMVEGKKPGLTQAEDWAPLIDKYEVKFDILFGAAMNQLLQAFPNRTFPSVQEIMYGGSTFPPSLVLKSMKQFPNADFKQGYAMTECLPMTELGVDIHKQAKAGSKEATRLLASAGLPNPVSKIFIEPIDSDTKKQLGIPSDAGQVCAWSPFIMKEYFKNPEKTAEAIGPDGYLRTGDVGRIDEDGYVHIVGRMKELIPTHRGFNVAPRDIEEVLFQHDAVGQAAVIGSAHPAGTGDMVVAWVTPKAGQEITQDELRDHCIAANMPQWQLPDLIHISQKQLPVVGGKISKQTLQAPTFVLRNLQDSIDTVLQEARESNNWYKLGRDVFERIDGNNDGVLDFSELSAVFKEQGRDFLNYFDNQDEGNDLVDQFEWIEGISKMKPEARITWLTQASSILAQYERQQVLSS